MSGNAVLDSRSDLGGQLQDADSVLNALKTCLRTPNQHVSSAALGAIAAFVPLLVHSTTSSAAATSDAVWLRQALTAFLSSGGILDRLGDSRDSARLRARETLAAIGGSVFRHSSTMATKQSRSQESPMALFERLVREGAFASKAWRVREQVSRRPERMAYSSPQIILTLMSIRRAHSAFPIRAYLPSLVDTLEDSDGTVRDVAREGVIELFSSPGVSDAARADLKKEMIKRGVRKAIIDAVLSRVLGSGAITPQSSDARSLEEAVATGPHPTGRIRTQSTTSEAQASRTPRIESQAVERPLSRAAETPSVANESSVAPVYVSV